MAHTRTQEHFSAIKKLNSCHMKQHGAGGYYTM